MGRHSNADEFSLMLGKSPGHLGRFSGLTDVLAIAGLGSRHSSWSWQGLSTVWKEDPFNVREKLIPYS
jgi:hypothetical protein